jgi:putative aldouronate transport system substrate-binding protein
MKKLGKFVAALLAAVLLVGVAPSSVQTVEARGLLDSLRNLMTRGGGTTQEADVKTFTAWAANPLWNGTNSMDDPIGRAITAATGVKLVGESPVGPWGEALALMLASGDLPDVIYNISTSRATLYDAGAIRPLKDYMMNAPNIMKYYGDNIKRLAYNADDRDFYSIGTSRRDSEANPGEFWEWAYWVQYPALEAAGFPMLRTPADFEKVIADFIKDNPTTKDGKPIYGLSFMIGNNWRESLLMGITHSAGLPADNEWYVDQNTWEVTSILRHSAAKQYIQWLNHMNDIGLLDPETVTQSQDMLSEKVANGQIAGLAHAKWLLGDAMNNLIKNDPGHDFLGFPLRWMPNSTQYRDLQDRGPEGIGASITTAVSDEDTQVLINFYDFLISDEGMLLQQWGIEGEHYTFDKSDNSKDWKSSESLYVGNDDRGPRRLAPEVWDLLYAPGADRVNLRNQTGLQKYANNIFCSFLVSADGYILNDYAIDADIFFNGRSPEQQKVLTAYGIKAENQMFPPGSPRTLGLPQLRYGATRTLPVGNASEAHAVAREQYLEAIPVELSKLLVVPKAQFDAEWDKFINFLDNQVNVKILEDELTKSLRDRLFMWYEE